MAWRDATAAQSIVIVTNAAIRACQVGVGALTIFLYASEKHYWPGCGLPAKFAYEFVLGVFAIVTGLVLGFVPFRMPYRPVAFAAPWDVIMFFMYSAAFGVMKKANDNLLYGGCWNLKETDEDKALAHYNSMHDKIWVNLAGMLLFLGSAIMGFVLLWWGRKNGITARHSAV